jgi:hypothetical protein
MRLASAAEKEKAESIPAFCFQLSAFSFYFVGLLSWILNSEIILAASGLLGERATSSRPTASVVWLMVPA